MPDKYYDAGFSPAFTRYAIRRYAVFRLRR